MRISKSHLTMLWCWATIGSQALDAAAWSDPDTLSVSQFASIAAPQAELVSIRPKYDPEASDWTHCAVQDEGESTADAEIRTKKPRQEQKVSDLEKMILERIEEKKRDMAAQRKKRDTAKLQTPWSSSSLRSQSSARDKTDYRRYAEGLLRVYDRDKDEKLNRDEIQAMRSSKNADKNGDGFVDKQELKESITRWWGANKSRLESSVGKPQPRSELEELILKRVEQRKREIESQKDTDRIQELRIRRRDRLVELTTILRAQYTAACRKNRWLIFNR